MANTQNNPNFTVPQPPPPPRRPTRPGTPPGRAPRPDRSTMTLLLLGGAFAAGLLMVLMLIGFIGILMFNRDRVPSGVSIAGVSIGGQRPEQARSQIAGLTLGEVTATDGDRTFPLALSDLGVAVDVEGTLEAAQDAPPNTTLTPRYTIDLTRAQQALIALSEAVNIEALPGNPPQIGRALDIPFVLDRLRLDVNGELSDGVLDLNIILTEPPPPETPNVSATARTTHVVESGQELALIARQYGVGVEDIVRMNNLANADLIYVGQELIIPAAGIYTPEDAPPAPTPSGRAILVSVGDQRIYAYENGQMVRSHLVSTGLPETPTVLGDYRVYVKYAADDMRGPDYFLPQVPWMMYFYQGYAIHGTYWHNSFGRPMSHGCVNLPVAEAQWFYEFADVGTLVRVVT